MIESYKDDDGVYRCPKCGAPERVKGWNEGGGVECSERCGWWFCY